MCCVLCHHARKGVLPGERDLEEELPISEGSDLATLLVGCGILRAT